MKGYWNHHFLQKSEFIGLGEIKGYDMYHVDCFPGIVPGEGSILGEVYEINERTLQLLDGLEGEGTMYIRKEEEANIEENMINVYVYIWNKSISRCEKVKDMPWKPRDGGTLWNRRNKLE